MRNDAQTSAKTISGLPRDLGHNRIHVYDEHTHVPEIRFNLYTQSNDNVPDVSK